MVAIQPSAGPQSSSPIADDASFNGDALTVEVRLTTAVKVISSAGLIGLRRPVLVERGRLPTRLHGAGITYHNDNNESLGAGTPFVTDFARSSNNAFSVQWPHLSGGKLAHAARNASASTSPGTSASPACPAPSSTPRPAPAAPSWRRRRSARDS